MTSFVHGVFNEKGFGLTGLSVYFHIPFCERICHYCDFVKTARYNPTDFTPYVAGLQDVFTRWFAPDNWKFLGTGCPEIKTVFFGGGTPGLLRQEFEPLTSLLKPFLASDYEMTLETNPENCSPESLQLWSELGFNRLSVGVQTTHPRGLKFLTREHLAPQIHKRLETIKSYFDNYNVDLIYGWPSQTLHEWIADLEVMIAMKVPHLSAYNLIYEPKTVIGRRLQRGKINAQSDQHLTVLFETAQQILRESGYQQDEVSNWSMPGYDCQHNWNYWQDGSYVGIGAGAHGYLVGENGPGVRYSFSPHLNSFGNSERCFPVGSMEELLKYSGVVLDTDRRIETWLMEYVGAGLRTSRGICLDHIRRKAGFELNPSGIVKRGLEEGHLFFEGDRLKLAPVQWFRETAWCTAIVGSFR